MVHGVWLKTPTEMIFQMHKSGLSVEVSNFNPLGPIEHLSVSSKMKNYLKLPKRRFLYFQNETTYSIIFGIILKL